MEIISELSEKCQICPYVDDCDEKRMMACAVVKMPEPIMAETTENFTEPLAADMAIKHDYRNIKIGENTTVTIDLEEMKKKIADDIYKALRCDFLQGGV